MCALVTGVQTCARPILHASPLARPARLRPIAAIALLLLLGQIIYGAFTAGLGAGYAFASWPLMGDSLFPAGVPMLDPAWTNAIDNPVVVQFIHRWPAFVRSDARRAGKAGRRTCKSWGLGE